MNELNYLEQEALGIFPTTFYNSFMFSYVGIQFLTWSGCPHHSSFVSIQHCWCDKCSLFKEPWCSVKKTFLLRGFNSSNRRIIITSYWRIFSFFFQAVDVLVLFSVHFSGLIKHSLKTNPLQTYIGSRRYNDENERSHNDSLNCFDLKTKAYSHNRVSTSTFSTKMNVE